MNTRGTTWSRTPNINRYSGHDLESYPEYRESRGTTWSRSPSKGKSLGTTWSRTPTKGECNSFEGECNSPDGECNSPLLGENPDKNKTAITLKPYL